MSLFWCLGDRGPRCRASLGPSVGGALLRGVTLCMGVSSADSLRRISCCPKLKIRRRFFSESATQLFVLATIESIEDRSL